MIVKEEIPYIVNKTITKGGSSSTTPFLARNFNKLIVYVNVTHITGVSPSLQLDIVELVKRTNSWIFVTTVTPIFTSAGTRRIVLHDVGFNFFFNWTVGGTSPSFNLNVDVVGIREL